MISPPLPVQTRTDLVERLAGIRAEIHALGVRRLQVFGSFARDEATEPSDVDLLVEYAPGAKGFAAFMALADLLEATLGRRVDLVTVESVSPYLRDRILGEAAHVLGAA
jgi:uncharacterized protein